MKIFIESEIIKNQDLSDKAISAYVALRAFVQNGKASYLLSVKQLWHMLTGNTEIDRGTFADIKNGLSELGQAGYIRIIAHVGKSEYLLDLSDLFFESGNSFFVVVEDTHLPKIFSCDCNRHRLLRYYILLLSTLITKERQDRLSDGTFFKCVGYMPQSHFINQLSISQKSLYTYTSLLECMELIYVYRPEKYMTVEGKIRSFPNVYGRYEDKDAILAAGIAFVESYHAATYKKKTDSGLKRLTGKFRYIRDSGKVYDDKTMEQVYLAMVEQNKKLRARYPTDELYNRYKKDLTIFSSYPFYLGDDVSGNKGGDGMD